MNFTFFKIELLISLILSLLLCFILFVFWRSRQEEKAYPWLTLLFATNSFYTVARLLQYIQLDVTLYPLISNIILTTGLISLISIYGFVNAYTNFDCSRKERVSFLLVILFEFVLIWFTDLILTNQPVKRTLISGETFTGVEFGPAYPYAIISAYVIIILLSIRLMQSRIKPPFDKYLLSGSLLMMVLIGLNDMITLFFGFSWILILDIYALPFGLAVTYTQVRRYSSLYNQLEIMVQERTNSLQQTNKDLQNQIFEREKAEKTLRESEKKYRYVIENANDAILIIQDAKFKYVNPKTEKMTGYSYYELMNIDGEDLIHPEDFEMVSTRHIRRLKGEDVPSTYTFRLINKHGETLWIQQSAVLIEWEGRPASLNFFRDLTQMRKMEIQLNNSQRMEAIGTLAGGIAHEFNNILGIILGNAELAADDIPDRNPVREYIDEIYDATIRGRDIVKQLLSYSQKSEGSRQILNVSKVINDSLKYLRAILPASIEYRQNISNDCFNTLGDATQIHQVMMNLYKNAADAIDSEGVIEICVENIEILQENLMFELEVPIGKYVKIEVKDSGQGIQKDVLKCVFDPFFTTKEIGKGSGLGLSVVHGIIKKHNGFINIESEVGKGTIVTMFFPASDAKLPVTNEKSKTLISGTEIILFVDDEKSVASSTSKRLEKLGYQIETFTDPIEALSRFNSDPDFFDIIITDMTMPKMSGDKLIEKIHCVKKRFPSIICTGYNEKIDEEIAADKGIDAFLIKPIQLETLAKTIRKVVDSQSD